MGNGEMKLNRYPKYKPTGIAWLPEVPEGWECVPLKRCASIQTGSTPKTVVSEYWDAADFPWYTPSDISSVCESTHCLIDSSKKISGLAVQNGAAHRFEAGVVLMVCIGSLGRLAIAEKPCSCNQQINGIECHSLLNNYFAAYALLSQRRQIESRACFTTLPILNQTKTGQIAIPLPPLPTQRAIVAFLDGKCGKIDRWVAAKEREVALLKELKQAMIAEAVTGATNVARTDTARKMKPSGIPWLPEVPEGWEVKKVRQHFRLRSEKVSEQDYPPLSVAKVGVVPQLADVAISMAQGETRKLVREGDYVVNSRSDRKGSCGIAPQDGSVTTISIVLEPRQIDRQFVHYLFRSTPWVEEFYRNGRGIVADLWTTRYQEMRNMTFPVPPLAEQRAIVAYIEARAAKIDAAVAGLEREVAAMKEYKQRLIADVVTGQRKVA